jgi:putative membrane protein
VLFLLAAMLKQFAVPVVLTVFVGVRSSSDNWELFALPILVPYAGFVVARYLTFHYAYGDGELVIRSGLFFKNERHIPYSRIQNLDAVQNAVHRLLGVVDVKVDTGSGAETDATLSVVSWPAYEEMRRRVLEERATAMTEASGETAAVNQPILTLSLKDLAVFGFIENRAAVLVAAVFGVLWESGLFETAIERLGIDVAGRGVLTRVARAVFRDGSLPWNQILWGVGAFIGLLIVLRLFSIVWAMVRLHGFRLSQVGADLRTEYGLLTRVSATVPLHRIQTVTVRRGLIHRWLDRASVRAETAGGTGRGGGSSRQRESLAPIVGLAAVPELLRAVLPDLVLTPAEWQPPAPAAFRRELRVRLVMALVGAGLSAFLLGSRSLWLLALRVGWAWVSARVYTRHLGWAVVPGAVLFRNGWIWRHTTVARFSKVQAVTLRQSPFDRRHHMASVRVDTAGAGDASHRVDIPYLPEATAADLYSRVAAAAAGTSFRW